MLSDLSRPFQLLNCWKYCCFNQKQQPEKSFILRPGFSSKPKNQPPKTNQMILGTTLSRAITAANRTNTYLTNFPLFTKKILSNYTETTIYIGWLLHKSLVSTCEDGTRQVVGFHIPDAHYCDVCWDIPPATAACNWWLRHPLESMQQLLTNRRDLHSCSRILIAFP